MHVVAIKIAVGKIRFRRDDALLRVRSRLPFTLASACSDVVPELPELLATDFPALEGTARGSHGSSTSSALAALKVLADNGGGGLRVGERCGPPVAKLADAVAPEPLDVVVGKLAGAESLLVRLHGGAGAAGPPGARRHLTRLGGITETEQEADDAQPLHGNIVSTSFATLT